MTILPKGQEIARQCFWCRSSKAVPKGKENNLSLKDAIDNIPQKLQNAVDKIRTRTWSFEPPNCQDPESFRKTPLVFEQNVQDIKQPDKFRLQYLSKLSCEKAWVPQEQRPPKHQTVIIFDWDDTLMYSSFLFQLHEMGRDISRVNASTKQQLASIESAVYKVLEMSVGLGHTFIITNAAEGWVQDCVQHYMPSLIPILEKVRVISARSHHQWESAGKVDQWKKLAFLELGRQLDSQIVTNLVSVGDSNFEHDALHVLGKQFEKKLVKTVKLQEQPSPLELMKELDLLVPKFQGLVEKASNMKIGLERKT